MIKIGMWYRRERHQHWNMPDKKTRYIYIYTYINNTTKQLNYIVVKRIRLQLLYQLIGNLTRQTPQAIFIDTKVLSKLSERFCLKTVYFQTRCAFRSCVQLIQNAWITCIPWAFLVCLEWNIDFWWFNSLWAQKNIEEPRQGCLLRDWNKETLLF